MRLDWWPAALADLAALAERAPVTARRVVSAVETFASWGFPDIGVPLPGRRERFLVVSTQLVIYQVAFNRVVVTRVVDARKRRQSDR